MIGGRYVKGEQIRINYTAKRLTTGLSDVTISILRSDGNKEIDGASMTELNATNAPGVYYYDWTPTKPGTMTIYCDSTSQPNTYIDILQVDSRGSKYTQVMGVHGGMSRVTVNDTWTGAEKQKFLDEVRNIAEAHKKSVESLMGLSGEVSELNKQIKFIDSRVENQVSKSQRMSQNMFQQVANKVNKLNEETTEHSSKLLTSNLENSKLFQELSGSINKKLNQFDDKIETTKELQDSKVNKLQDTNIVLSEKVNNLKNEIKELHENVSQFGKILIKLVPQERLLELKDEIK